MTGGEVFLGPTDERLRGRSGRGVVVATVDSGIAAGHPHVGAVAGGVGFDAHDAPVDDFVDRVGHGTAVAAVIREKAPEARLLAVRVFDDVLRTTAHRLVQGVDWAVNHGAHLVNLSLGTPNPEHGDALQAAVSRANDRGVLVVSALEHDGTRWFPGSLAGTIGVLLDWDCPREGIRLSSGAGRALVHASGYPRPIPGVPPRRNLHGISFAVANVSGILACALEGRDGARSGTEVLSWLQTGG